jgi:bifunctional non-homologous end joining protein LigD
MNRILMSLPEQIRKKLIRREQPSWINPMLATLTDKRFSDKSWIFEKKHDGVRALAFCKGREVRIFSRNKLSFTDSYPEIVSSLRGQPCDQFIIDGEIVAIEKGVSSFAKLQQRMRAVVVVYYYVFDLLYLDGYETTHLPLLHRKQLLRTALQFDRRVRYTTHRVEKGEAYFEEACRKNWEGIIAKRSDSLYVAGRSRDWLKFKCSQQQELVIVGYTDPAGKRTDFGALLVGYYSGNHLLYAGKVGTGFTAKTLHSLKKQLSALERKTPPVQGIGLPRRNVHWVEPVLVAQIAFSEWTDDNKLRHPSFLGLRQDKNPKEVIREEAVL